MKGSIVTADNVIAPPQAELPTMGVVNSDALDTPLNTKAAIAYIQPSAKREFSAALRYEKADGAEIAIPTIDKIPDVSKWHLEKYPFRAPQNVADCTLWYEGTFDPMGPHHLQVLKDTMALGFDKAVLALCFQTPYKGEPTPFAHREAMIKAILRMEGIPIAEKRGDIGVFIYTDSERFQWEKTKAWFDPHVYHLMGPDNFDAYYRRNVNWSHDSTIRESALGQETFQFRNLYYTEIASRILVFPVLHDVHATDIRKGTIPPHPAVHAYIQEHGLYQGEVSAKLDSGRAAREQRQFSPESFELYDNLTDQIAEALKEQGLEGPHVHRALERTLASFDDTQLDETAAAFVEGTERKAKWERDPRDSSEYVAPIKCVRKIRDAIMEGVLGPNLTVEGMSGILQASRQHRKFYFVSNFSGSGDLALIPYALQSGGATAVAERLAFVVGQELFKTSLEHMVIAQSSGLVSIPTTIDGEDFETHDNAHEHGLKRMRKREYPVVFPEGAPHSGGLGVFGHGYLSVLDGEGFDAVGLRNRGLDLDDVVIVPLAHQGANHIFSNRAAISDEAPVGVSFGKPVTVELLNKITAGETDAVRGHVVGYLVARLLPPEQRGVYGNVSGDEFYTEDSLPFLSKKDLDDMARARQIVDSNPDLYQA